MINAYVTLGLSLVMAFAIFLSMPIVFYRKLTTRQMLFLNAGAIGILVFLLMDIYGDVAAVFGNNTILNPYLIIFMAGFVLMYLFFVTPKSSRDPEENPKRTSTLAAIGIGFQNLTEGLLFGSAGAAGLVSIYVLSITAFTLQNFTEGFPIAAPLMGMKRKVEKRFMAGAFLIGGLPTVMGTVIGLVFFSNYFLVFFDGLASAAILYVVFVLFHVNINRGAREAKDQKEKSNYIWLTYLGILVGFVIAYILNYAIAY